MYGVVCGFVCEVLNSKLNKFLHSEVNLLIQHIIVQDQDGQNMSLLIGIMHQHSLFFLLSRNDNRRSSSSSSEFMNGFR